MESKGRLWGSLGHSWASLGALLGSLGLSWSTFGRDSREKHVFLILTALCSGMPTLEGLGCQVGASWLAWGSLGIPVSLSWRSLCGSPWALSEDF